MKYRSSLSVSTYTPKSCEHSSITPQVRVKDNRLDESCVHPLERCLLVEEICSVFCKQKFYLLPSASYFVATEATGIFLSGVKDKKKRQIIEKLVGIHQRAAHMIYNPGGTAFRGKMKETSLPAWPPALTNRDWLIGHKYLKGVNSRDREELFNVLQGDSRRSDGNESQNKDDLGSGASFMP